MASQQAGKEVQAEYVQTLQPNEFEYTATRGGWIVPTDDHPMAELPQAVKFSLTGTIIHPLKETSTVNIWFELSVGSGFPNMSQSMVCIFLKVPGGDSYYDSGVRQPIRDMKPNTKTWFKGVFNNVKVPADSGPVYIELVNQGSAVVGGLTFYQAKIEEFGKE